MSEILTIARYLSDADRANALAADVRAGLTAKRKSVPPKWFYDATGSLLFDEVTRLPEYYPTRRELAILRVHAGEIAELTAADTIVELGSGTSDKTRILLTALSTAGTLRRFIPFDVDESILRTTGAAIAGEFPDIQVDAVVGDFERHLALLPTGGRRLIVFLGGTIGNLTPKQRARFLTALQRTLTNRDYFLLGTDLMKNPARIVNAYDDDAGVGVRFNRNMLQVFNHALDADFVPSEFGHVARWNADEEWLEVRLRAERKQDIHLKAIDLHVHFDSGEELLTQISAKFRLQGVIDELEAAGLELRHWWTDPAGDFALSLSRPADHHQLDVQASASG